MRRFTSLLALTILATGLATNSRGDDPGGPGRAFYPRQQYPGLAPRGCGAGCHGHRAYANFPYGRSIIGGNGQPTNVVPEQGPSATVNGTTGGANGQSIDHSHHHAAGASATSGGSTGPSTTTGTPATGSELPSQPAGASASGKQITCPVTGEKLGEMGAPISVNLKGQTIQVCCQSCVNKVQKDPDTYLAKVKAEMAGTAVPGASD